MSDIPTSWQRGDGLLPKRSIMQALWRGFAHACPACGHGRLFHSYLKVSDACADCGAELHHHRADDAPPYFTIVLVAHVVVPLMLMVEKGWAPALWVHSAIWLPLTLAMSLAFLPAIKGALVGYQWALYMHGFDPRSGGDESWDAVGFKTSRGEG